MQENRRKLEFILNNWHKIKWLIKIKGEQTQKWSYSYDEWKWYRKS